MLPQVADFQAEANELHALLAALTDADWERKTLFKSWTINDVVQHLHDSDLMALASAAGPEALARFRAEVQVGRDRGLTRLEETRLRLGHLTAGRLLERWHMQMVALCDRLSALPKNARLKWAGPDMGVRMFATARQMETWAHGQEIYDLVGADRVPTARLRNVAELGVRTFGWTFANRGIAVPGPVPYVHLQGPMGEAWEWGENSPDSSVIGNALDFCQVVTQVRNVADTSLQVSDGPAKRWMELAQCFAGPPEDPPRSGTRLSASL